MEERRCLCFLYSVATLFATTSNPVQDTCSPKKIFDSFAASVPIIQTSKGWIRDLVDTSQCGVNVELNTPEETAIVMLKMANDPIGTAKMGQNAKALAESDFNRDSLAKKYMEIFQSIQ